MKKILYIITRIENSGPNKVLENMLSGVDKKRYKIFVLSLFDCTSKFKKYQDVQYISLGLKNYCEAFVRGKFLIKNIKKQINPDIVHSHGILPDYFNTFFKDSNKISTLHCNIYADYKYGHNIFVAIIMIKLHLHFLKKINNVVCCSKSVFNEMQKSKLSNMLFIENGIRDEICIKKSEVRGKLNIKKGDIVFIYIGTLSKRKNVQVLTKLVKENFKENEHLLILGDGELKNEIINISNDVNNIHILGFKSNIDDYLCCSDVYISASLAEGLSISVIEALNDGLLLLLSDIESHKEFYNKDSTYIGEVFNENDFKDKLKCIRKKVKEIDKKNIMTYKSKYFSDKSMMKEYEVLYEEK